MDGPHTLYDTSPCISPTPTSYECLAKVLLQISDSAHASLVHDVSCCAGSFTSARPTGAESFRAFGLLGGVWSCKVCAGHLAHLGTAAGSCWADSLGQMCSLFEAPLFSGASEQLQLWCGNFPETRTTILSCFCHHTLPALQRSVKAASYTELECNEQYCPV